MKQTITQDKLLENQFSKLEREIEAEEDFKSVSLSELMAMEFSDLEWLVEPLVPAEGNTAVSGDSSVYKTWMMLEIAVTVATGGILFDKFVTTQNAVLVVDEENGNRLLQKRLRKLQTKYDLPVYFITLKGFKLDKENVRRILEDCKGKGIKLVIFDSLIRIHDKNENESQDMAKVLGLLKGFNKEGIAVIFTHHNRKQGLFRNPSQDMRGSSDIRAFVDCHLAVERKSDCVHITQTKLRQAEEIKPFKLSVISDGDEFKFEYVSEVDEVQNKKADMMEAIKDALEQEGKPKYKQELYQQLKAAGIDGGYSTFKIAVGEMVKANELFEKKGEKNKVFLWLHTMDEKQDG